MTKIGILTYHNTTNYGALLQAFALQSKLRELGADVETINYHCKEIEQREHITFPKIQKNIKRYLSNIRSYYHVSEKRKVMDSFVSKYMKISNKEYYRNNINEANEIYDKFVVGSDMVFATQVNGGDMTYYLDFAYEKKRYSYAASLGFDTIEDKYLEQCKKELEMFQHLSVREEQCKDYFSKMLINKVYVDVDPTLLYDGSFWQEYEEKPGEEIKKGYILLYFLNKNMPEFEIARKIAKENNLDIYLLSNNKVTIDGCKVIYNASVGEFLYYIHNAKLVITASFHGMIFSMNYNTNFMYFSNNGSSSRLENIANITNSTDRRLTVDKIPALECNFSKINKAVSKIREQSIEYLNSLIDDNNVIKVRKEDCCGCSACMAVCPVDAISMKADSEGFLYPSIDKSKCINCGLCLKTCENIKNVNKENDLLNVYAAKNKNYSILKQSSSGGISYALCEHFIKNNGVVYGVIYDENHKVVIEREDSVDGIKKLFGSKYVQANPQNTFKQVYEDLKKKKSVLYIATSCYIAKLKSYLEIKRCNQNDLYTVDLVCHGTPSPKIFDDYINYLKKKYDFDHFEFRTKKLPWGYGSKNYGCTIYLKNGKEITNSLDSNLYLKLFFSNYCLRPHCSNCLYANVNKPADITIADYWGLKEEHPEFFDEGGVSAILTHTKKGDKLFKQLDSIDYIESDIEKVIKKQANLTNPSPMKDGRNDFWNLYYIKGFKSVCKKYAGLNMKSKIKRMVKKVIRK